jgi:hypothetical protein
LRRDAELAHDDDVERSVECSGDLGSDPHAAPREPEDDAVAMQMGETTGEAAAGVDTIVEQR